MKEKTNIIIFGSNGQLANALITEFANYQDIFEIIILDRKNIDFANISQVQYFFDNLKQIISHKIHFIINAIAYTNVDRAEEEREICDNINHKSVAIIAKYCHQNQIKLIHYSTDYVFDGSGTEPFLANNSKNLSPINFYGKTKLAAEEAITKSFCEALIIRVSWLYDNRPESRNFINTITRLAQEQEIIKVVNDQFGSPTSVCFIASTTIKIINKIVDYGFSQMAINNANNINGDNPNSLIIHLNNNKFISWYDFALEIIKDLEKKQIKIKVKKLLPIATSDYKTKAKRPLNSRLACNIDNYL